MLLFLLVPGEVCGTGDRTRQTVGDIVTNWLWERECHARGGGGGRKVSERVYGRKSYTPVSLESGKLEIRKVRYMGKKPL